MLGDNRSSSLPSPGHRPRLQNAAGVMPEQRLTHDQAILLVQAKLGMDAPNSLTRHDPTNPGAWNEPTRIGRVAPFSFFLFFFYLEAKVLPLLLREKVQGGEEGAGGRFLTQDSDASRTPCREECCPLGAKTLPSQQVSSVPAATNLAAWSSAPLACAKGDHADHATPSRASRGLALLR
ncbi:uncharacterized protein N7482_008145 [Penicillium canariense]|uniref:Uncharacterized protein n=1 Tax=Penicillium canariense TaxID=189055 RepID=A0A9W9LIQ0_9EURO|nr:uncharacterized protein N7482_008145 [Penicillium canariense]KAJ5157045.1 hypothetical protein N7482_008145 [Penicillium canariense]